MKMSVAFNGSEDTFCKIAILGSGIMCDAERGHAGCHGPENTVVSLDASFRRKMLFGYQRAAIFIESGASVSSLAVGSASRIQRIIAGWKARFSVT
jgi:hypothetical protein